MTDQEQIQIARDVLTGLMNATVYSDPGMCAKVVEVSGITYQRTEVGDWSSAHRWISRNSHEANTLDALYRALHPVADAATVERVAEALFHDRKRVITITLDWSDLRDDLRKTHRIAARAALRALGYTIQEGA